MRQLLRLNVVEGTGKNADVAGYEVGGKTGTAEKPGRGGYRQKALISSFVGVFPMNDPKFVDHGLARRAQGPARDRRLRHGGWVAAPSVKNIIEAIVSLYGILPGDLKEGLPPLEIASTPVPRAGRCRRSSCRPSVRRRRAEQRKALPVAARPGADGGRTRCGSASRCVLSELMRRSADATATSSALPRDPVLAGLTLDSRKVRPGYLFAALPGTAAGRRDLRRRCRRARRRRRSSRRPMRRCRRSIPASSSCAMPIRAGAWR